MKKLPYFKFITSEWLIGDILFEDLEAQGLFINICALYWHRGGILSVEDINKRFNKPTAFNSLCNRFISVNSENNICIKFLDEQFKDLGHISEVNSQNGKKGGRPKGSANKNKKPTAFNSLTETKPKKSNKEEEIEKKEEIEKEVFNFKKSLLNLCEDKKLVEEWLRVRSKKKLVDTETALKGFLKQVELSGYSVTEVLTKCVEKSWGGFEAAWHSKETKQKSEPSQQVTFDLSGYTNFG